MNSPRTITRADHVTEVIPFTARDGTPLTLVHVTSAAPADSGAPEKGPVLLVHGAGVRAELFRPPLPRTLVDALLEDGWDVWLLNWRASIDLEPLSWTLGDAAVYDHPAAVDYVLGATGAETLKAVIHCQGSVSFTMAAVAGLLPRVDTVVSNAVSLHPVIPLWSVIKITYLAELLKPFTPCLSPAWGYKSNGYFSRILRSMVKATHHECDNLVCRLVSFTYGSGRPALWSHENLDVATHDWISGEFAEVPFTFLSEMGRSVLARRMVAAGNHPELPANFLAEAPQTDARFSFLAGRNNRCFLPESQERTFAFFQGHRPGRDSLHLLPGYGHLDVFFGARAWADTYPVILKELNR
ncbi:pimeloyl-ACP methyl ester carboxylesterase [Arthrobacter sp. PvP023]|uniref:alpha/beta fold hydrolase n=1 Tax=Micrococcaceae TaxID=1268 RepID=UPI001AE0F1CE|nr:alpha/beta fold hydrolase [Arthrobacter sp. PvP023]MBP1137077.1 pimeloyl-ACP methyl ester carboxylesterase [Arthrobacter sp. PvP023]